MLLEFRACEFFTECGPADKKQFMPTLRVEEIAEQVATAGFDVCWDYSRGGLAVSPVGSMRGIDSLRHTESQGKRPRTPSFLTFTKPKVRGGSNDVRSINAVLQLDACILC